MTITLPRPATDTSGGRHRLGRPGLVPVTALVAVVHRGWLSHLFRPGRHLLRATRARRGTAGAPLPAVG